MGIFKGAASVCVAAVAVLIGLVKGPQNPISVEIIDALDRFLDSIQASPDENKKDRYQNGIFAPVFEEHNSGIGLELELLSGTVPDGIDGVFFKIGPNLPMEPTKKLHVFDSDGMVHTVRIQDGKAHYHNAFVQTPRLKVQKERGRLYFPTIGEITGAIGIFKVLFLQDAKVKHVGVDVLESHPMNTAINFFANGRILVGYEGGRPFEIRVSELGEITSVGFENGDGRLEVPVSAHPKTDWKTGETFFHSYTPTGGADGKTFCSYGRFDKKGKLQELFRLNFTGAAFNHDIVLTENHIIVMDSSIRFNKEGILTGSLFKYEPNYTTQLAVIPRSAKSAEDVQYFNLADATGWVHPFGAWEEENGETLVMWAPWAQPEKQKRVAPVIEGCCDLWHMGELRLNKKAGHSKLTLIDDGSHHGEFSRIRDNLVGQGFVRYGFTGASDRVDKADFDFIGISKWDFKEKKLAKEIIFEKGWTGTEPVLIPASTPSGEASDDGYIAMLLHGDKETHLALYDARTLDETPVARWRLPKRVPVGFHSTWMQKGQLDNHLKHWSEQ